MIIAAFVIKILLASVTEFMNDEVYYTIWTHYWQWSYFDHPAGIGILQRLTTFNGHWVTELSARLGSMICSVIQIAMVFRIVEKLSGRHAAWLGALALTAMPYGNLIAGWMVMPDVPLMTGWMLALAQMVTILGEKEEEQFSLKQGMLLGLTLALALLSKVHGLFLGFGIGLVAVTSHRHWWKKAGWFACIAIGASGIIPQLLWNLANGSPMTSYQGGRIGHRIHWDDMFRDLFAGMGYQNPFVMVLIIGGLILWIRNNPFRKNPYTRLFLFCSIPLLIAMMGVALYGDSLPHWTGPTYMTLLPLAAAGTAYAARPARYDKWIMRGWWFLQIGLVVLTLFANFFPSTTNILTPDKKLGAGDLTLDFTGWKAWKDPLNETLKKDPIIGKKPDSVWLLSGFYFPGAHIEHYFARPLHLRSKPVGPFNNIHNFYFTSPKQGGLKPRDNAVYLDISNYARPMPDAVRNAFDSVGWPVFIPQMRSGTKVRNLVAWPLYNYKSGIPETGLVSGGRTAFPFN
jgi:hypothetical protein